MRDKRGAFSSIPKDQDYTEMLNAGVFGWVQRQHRASEGGTSTPTTVRAQEIQKDVNQDHQGVDIKMDIRTLKMKKGSFSFGEKMVSKQIQIHIFAVNKHN